MVQLKIATRTKTNIELLKKEIQIEWPKETPCIFLGHHLISRCQHQEGKRRKKYKWATKRDNLHIFWASSGLIPRCQHREGKSGLKKNKLSTFTQTAKSTWSQNDMTHTSGVQSSLQAEVSHDEAKWNERRETSAGFWRVVWWSRRPNFSSKLTGFQNRFRLMLDCTLTIIEPTVDYCSHEICEFRNFSLWLTASTHTLGDKCIKK